MVTSFGPIALAGVVAILFGLLPLVLSARFAPRRPDRVKNAPYECGVETIGPTQIQFDAKFYIFALIFVIFDVEAIFLFPWAVTFGQFGLFSLVEIIIFVALLLVGYAYAWRKRALEWG
ncbi:MAG: NADH-quinone oxidoreductase subunit [Chloroflexota bacterium]|jgi:NADH-quinone oxidoreductase subunit A|nr:NADH-quinone oxidoreductase subunit [Chloroflexota bacterium]